MDFTGTSLYVMLITDEIRNISLGNDSRKEKLTLTAEELVNVQGLLRYPTFKTTRVTGIVSLEQRSYSG